METLEIERLLSEKLSNVLHTTDFDSDRVLDFMGWYASPNGNVVVNVQVSNERDESSSYYRCKISSPDGQYRSEGSRAQSLKTAIDTVQWSDIDSWTPYQTSD